VQVLDERSSIVEVIRIAFVVHAVEAVGADHGILAVQVAEGVGCARGRGVVAVVEQLVTGGLERHLFFGGGKLYTASSPWRASCPSAHKARFPQVRLCIRQAQSGARNRLLLFLYPFRAILFYSIIFWPNRVFRWENWPNRVFQWENWPNRVFQWGNWPNRVFQWENWPNRVFQWGNWPNRVFQWGNWPSRVFQLSVGELAQPGLSVSGGNWPNRVFQ
jgi:hypothetical protein